MPEQDRNANDEPPKVTTDPEMPRGSSDRPECEPAVPAVIDIDRVDSAQALSLDAAAGEDSTFFLDAKRRSMNPALRARIREIQQGLHREGADRYTLATLREVLGRLSVKGDDDR